MANTKPLASQSRYPGPGSLAERTVDDKLREWISVADFGISGDGVTNNTAAYATIADRRRHRSHRAREHDEGDLQQAEARRLCH